MHGSTRLIAFVLSAVSLILTDGSAQAQYPSPRPPFTYIYPKAPDLMGSGMNPNAPFVTTLGPHFSVVPCHMPFQGMVLGPNCGGGGFAGGGVKSGFAFGQTDEVGLYAVENKVHLHDVHATILHLLGLGQAEFLKALLRSSIAQQEQDQTRAIHWSRHLLASIQQCTAPCKQERFPQRSHRHRDCS